MTPVEADDLWGRIDVSDWLIRGVEQVGSTRNSWLEDPDTGEEWLHKDTVIPANGVEQGEDWSEVVSTQVARQLGVPCATTRLCLRGGRRGSLSLSVVPDGHALWEGQLVLERGPSPGYFPHVEGMPGLDPDRPTVKRPGHNLSNIRDSLQATLPPAEFEGSDSLSAFDVFAGYMILDALIANRDRHEQNWAVLTPQLLSLPERLAPSYDHASSLGYNLTDQAREACLRDRQRFTAWARRGTAYRFEHEGKPVTLVQHAVNAVALCSAAGADWWRDRVAGVDLSPVRGALVSGVVPGMSEVAARFADDLLALNLRRLRDELG